MNERELEIIKQLRKELRKKKKLTSYDKGQLDLVKKLRKKQKPKKWETIMQYIAIGLGLITFILLGYMVYKNTADGTFAVQFRSEKYANSKENEQYCRSWVIDEKKAVAYIGYDCTPINRIFKGIKKCKGEYYIFLNKIDGKCIIDESSKTIIW